MNWKNVIHLDSLDFVFEKYNENYQHRSAELSKPMGAKTLGFHLEILEPKTFSCPYHFHHSVEELFLVLDGEATLRQADHFKKVVKGDLIHFTTGPEGAHQFYNHTDRPFKFLALSTKDQLDICEYPDSKKISIVKLKKTFQTGQEVEYFQGEEDPKIFWPKERL